MEGNAPIHVIKHFRAYVIVSPVSMRDGGSPPERQLGFADVVRIVVLGHR